MTLDETPPSEGLLHPRLLTPYHRIHDASHLVLSCSKCVITGEILWISQEIRTSGWRRLALHSSPMLPEILPIAWLISRKDSPTPWDLILLLS